MNEQMITVRVSPELHQRLKDAAEASATSLNAFCVAALWGKLGEQRLAMRGTPGDDEIVVDIDANGTPSARQMDLVLAITKYLESVGIVRVSQRQLNAVIRAADAIIDELRKPEALSAPGIGLGAWLMSDDTGISSEYMAGVLSGIFSRKYGYPRDGADFGRCVRLLDACPDLRVNLKRMVSGTGMHWDVLVDHWDELESLYREHYPDGDGERLDRSMMELYEPIEKGTSP